MKESVKKDLLSIIKMDYYLPLIRERTGIPLSDVVVKEYSDYFVDYYKNKYGNNFDSQNRFSRLVSKCMIKQALVKTRFKMAVSKDLRLFMYYDSNIYVNLGFQARVYSKSEGYDFRDWIEGQDKSVIHELSHHLWRTINPIITRGALRKLEEGFADYCAVNYFADIYTNTSNRPLYTDNIRIVRQIVDKYGPEIVLNIPRIGIQLLTSN